MRVGLISDTHGLLRPEALAFLRGSDHIIHAGDIVGPEILPPLEAIAPLTVVRGNNDRGAWAGALPETAVLRIGALGIYVIHDLKELPIDPAREGMHVVVSGHSHKPARFMQDGVLYVNPGSAGRRRFTLPISIGELLVDGGQARARLVTLDVS
ncbi:metallophosphoesterase family protein [Massilia consociata]|uniref:Phosphoesterase n=1 Tax=Massilia consociata TaxID=760117 RepID=A0ABV6FAS5_9BURK